MAIFDLFKKSKNKSDLIETIDKDVATVQMLSNAYLDLKSLKEVRNLSFSDIHSVEDAFEQIVPTVNAIYEETNKEGTGLYNLTNAIKGKVPLKLDNQDFASATMKLASGKSVAAINPYTLIIVAAVVAIQKETEMIHDECARILAFLKNDKEAQIEGDIAVLNNIIDGYKYNWDNHDYCQNNHKLALDIKRSSEQNCIFYQKQITGLINEQKKEVISKSTETRQKEFENNFKYYQMSLYLNSYSSYLEVLLLGNFDEKYLNSIIDKQMKLVEDYQNLYAKSLEKLEHIANNSVEAKALKGLGGFMQKAKKVDWINKTGKNIEDKGNKQKLDSFIELKNNENYSFIEMIKDLVFLTDSETEIYLNKDGFIFCKK